MKAAFRLFTFLIETEEKYAHKVRTRPEQEPKGHRTEPERPAEYAEENERHQEGEPRPESVPAARFDLTAQAEQDGKAEDEAGRIHDDAPLHDITASILNNACNRSVISIHGKKNMPMLTASRSVQRIEMTILFELRFFGGFCACAAFCAGI